MKVKNIKKLKSVILYCLSTMLIVTSFTFYNVQEINANDFDYNIELDDLDFNFYAFGSEDIEVITENEYNSRRLTFGDELFIGNYGIGDLIEWLVKIGTKVVGKVVKTTSGYKKVIIDASVGWVVEKALDAVFNLVKKGYSSVTKYFIADSSGNVKWEVNGSGCQRPFGSNNNWNCPYKLDTA